MKKILIWILFGIILIGGGIFGYFYFTTEKTLKLISPNAGEELRAGRVYQIKWKSKKIGKVGILLIEEDVKEPRTKWIVQDFPAWKQKYDWQIFVWEKPGNNYKIAILEYPWQEKNKIDYSDKFFTILGPKFASCDSLSLEAEWPYLPSDFPNLKKVFITNNSFSGNLEGLEGADKKCQEEAEGLGLKGNWKAFLGDDTTVATERLNLDGIFVLAPGEEILAQERVPYHLWQNFGQFLKTISQKKEEKEKIIENYNNLKEFFSDFLKKWDEVQDKKTCYRLLGKNFEEFFKKFSDPFLVNQGKFNENFLKNFSELWLGRLTKESKKDCLVISPKYGTSDLSRIYSFTTTCQNWKNGEELVAGYRSEANEKIELPECYSPEGKKIRAAGIGGFSSGLIKGSEEEKETQIFTSSLGKSCNTSQKLLCIEQ